MNRKTGQMKILLIFLIISTIGYSCTNTKEADDSNILTFNLEELPAITDLKLTDLGFIDISYIQFETKDSSLFSCTNNLIAGGKLIVGYGFFIVKCANDIIIFKSNGLFERKIGKVGRGPDEYQVAHDIQVDEKNREIYLLAGWQQKFFVYSYGGELVRTFQIPFFCNEFIFVENEILCYSENHLGNIDNSYNLIDNNGNILKSFANKYPFQNHDAYGIQGENLFYQFKNQNFKKEVYSDTVYLYQNGEFKSHLVINVGNKQITPNDRSQFDGRYLAKNYISPLKLFEFGDYVYYEFIYKFDFSKTEIYSFIGSANSDFRILFNTGQGIINDIDGGPNIRPKTISDYNTIIAFIDALEMKKYLATDEFKNSLPKYPKKKKELEQLANNLKETDNPVLVMVRLKE